jgi:hypothetical protein
VNGAASMAAASQPIEYWNELLQPMLEKSPELAEQFFTRLRTEKLTFGDRVHCPFLRPFFLSPDDEQRIRVVAETVAELGERVTVAAMEDPALLGQLHLRPDEERLVRLPVGYARASTASRLDAFLLPDSLKCAEYNGESPAGAGYSENLAQVFRDLPLVSKFSKRYEIHTYPLSAKLLEALIMSYLEWGGKTKRPQIAIVDWREVPTWTEFEILKSRFEKLQVPVVLADPRDLIFDGKTLSAHGKKIDLVYRRVLINDIVARPLECQALVKAYQANVVCVANTFRCKIPHVKAFFAVLTEEKNAKLFSKRELDLVRKHIPWTRVVEEVRTSYYGTPVDLTSFIRSNREKLVLKPSDEYGGFGVTLGWETDEANWDVTLQKALAAAKSTGEVGCWIVQERIPVRREVFPHINQNSEVEFCDMLVDLAPYLYRGQLCGYLTRLSATGLANVTSGGGQVPAFRISPRAPRAKKGP